MIEISWEVLVLVLWGVFFFGFLIGFTVSAVLAAAKDGDRHVHGRNDL